MQDTYNGKVLLAAVICLSIVILSVILLHVYGRWLLHRSRAAHTGSELTAFHRARRSSADEMAAAISSGDIGLDSTAVAALPLFVYSEKEQGGRMVDCVVCLSAMEEGEKGRFLPRCGHGFHACCIDVWLSANSTCPICRTPAAAAAGEEGDCEAVVVVESNEGSGEIRDVAAVEMGGGGKGDASSSSSCSSSSSSSSSMVSGSLNRMLSRSRSDKRVFPSVLECVHV